MRPHCQQADACVAKGPRHCIRCATQAPDYRARMADHARRTAVLQRPEVKARAHSPEARLKAQATRCATLGLTPQGGLSERNLRRLEQPLARAAESIAALDALSRQRALSAAESGLLETLIRFLDGGKR